jgi:phage gp29-like protein
MTDQSTDSRKNIPAEGRKLVAHARNDITIPQFTTVLRPTDVVLITRGGGQGLALYDEIERDPHAYAVLQKRKFALVGREWTVEPATDAPNDQQAASLVEDILSELNFDQLCLDLLDATLKGYSVAEVVWTRKAARIEPERIVAHDPRRFVFDEDWRPRLLTTANLMEGEPLPERKFITHRFGVKGNDPYGLGLGSRLFWPVLFKREGIAFWLTFLEKFASPTPVGKYPMGTLPADQDRLLQTLEGMVQAGAVVVPIGTELSFMEASAKGQVSYDNWCHYWDTQMALAVFGSTLATNVEGQGSRAAAETHKEGEEQIIDADSDLLSDTLRSTLFQWLVDFNLPGAAPPTLRRIRNKNALQAELLRKQRAENAAKELDTLFDLQARVGGSAFADTVRDLSAAGVLPDYPDDMLQRLAKAKVLPVTGRPSPGNDNGSIGQDRALQRQMQFAGSPGPDAGHDHGMTDLAAQLGQFAEPVIGDWLDVIRTEMARADAAGETLEQFVDRLAALDPDLTLDAMGNIMAPAFAAGELQGRSDVQDMTRAKRGSGRRRR